MLSRKWPARLAFLSALIALFAGYTLSLAQGNNPPTPLEIVRVNTKGHPHLEIVVSALDTTGRPLAGLTKDNFALHEDGTQIPITSAVGIADQNIPYAAVLLMDTSQSMTDDPLAKTKAAAIAFVNQVRDIDEVGLVAFNSTVTEVQAPTRDKAVVIRAINSLRAHGETALYDALAQGVKTALKSTATRRAIILLTDGNQYGPYKTGRNESFQLANKAGIPVFTIGLGYSIDEPYLQDTAKNTGGMYFASPTPNELQGIYSKIGTTLRALYVITFDTTLPADGATHVIRVDLTSGTLTASAATSARYPAPIPVIKFSGLDPNTPIDKPTTVTPQIEADNTLTGYEYQIDGKTAAKDNGAPKPLTIDPITLTPGQHQLSLAATDDQGHVGTGKTGFLVAALPPVFTVQGLKDNEIITADRPVTLTVSASQTPTGQATFDVDGTPIGSVGQAPYLATIKVLALTPGKHQLNVQLKNQGATGTRSVSFVVPTGPRDTATAQAIRTATSAARQTLTALPTNTSTPSKTNTSVPTITSTTAPANATTVPTDTPQLTSNANPPVSTDTPSPVPTDTPQPPSMSPVPSATGTPLPTLTFTPSDTFTPAPTNTFTPSATNTPLPTATFTPSDTFTPSVTNTPLPTATFTPSNTATPTASNTPTSTFTPSNTFTPTATTTQTPSPTPAVPLSGLLTAVSSPLGLLCGGLLLILIIVLVILLGGRRRRP